MDPIVAELVKNVPSAGAVIVVVIYFLRAIDKIITQFQHIEKERDLQWRNIFDSQRDAMNLVASHLKSLSEFLAQHDAWERGAIDKIEGNQEQIMENQRATITRRMRAVKGKKP